MFWVGIAASLVIIDAVPEKTAYGSLRHSHSVPVALVASSDTPPHHVDPDHPHHGPDGHPDGDALHEAMAGDHEEHHEGGHSIFMMGLTELDCKDFWLIVFCMLVFTIFIDRLQWYLTMKAEGNRCNKMFVDRVVGELMMFGVVAISVFIMTQLLHNHMAEHTEHLFEFTDVLCSFGACFLILVGMVLFVFRTWFEFNQDSHLPLDPKQILSDLERVGSLKELGSSQVASLQNSVKRAQFFARHKLTRKTFSWNMFLIETLNEGICDMINLNWITWVFSILLVGGFLIWRNVVGHMGTIYPFAHPHLVGYLVCTWLNWLSCLIEYVCIRLTHDQLRNQLGLTSVEAMRVSVKEAQRLESAIDQDEPAQIDKKEEFDAAIESIGKKSRVFAQLTQMLSLAMCFMAGFYVMHLIYNINHFKDEDHWVWHLAFLVPMATGLFVLTPLMILENASIQAFCDPSHDVMDSVIEQVHQAGSDLKFVKTQLETASGKGADTKAYVLSLFQAADVNKDEIISLKEFKSVLSKVGAKVGKERAKRLFAWITQDKGEVSAQHLVTVIFDPPAH